MENEANSADRIRRTIGLTWKERLRVPAVRQAAIRVLSVSALMMMTVRLLSSRSAQTNEMASAQRMLAHEQAQAHQCDAWLQQIALDAADSSILTPPRRAQLLDVCRHTCTDADADTT